MDNSNTYTFASDGWYCWRVRAVDGASNQSSWKSCAFATLKLDNAVYKFVMDKCKEGIMPEGRQNGRKAYRKFQEAKQQLRINDRKLRRMEENRWSHTKNMLKFGFASWIFGLSVFLFAIVARNTNFFAELFGPIELTWSSMLVGTPLLVGAPAAPVTTTAVSVRKFDVKIKHLRRIRRGLVTNYQRAVIQYVRQVAASKV